MGKICIVLKACITNLGESQSECAIYRGLCLRNYVIGEERGISVLFPGSCGFG